MIEFSHASFHYAAASARALEDVSFRVEAGELVVLAGRSGCGKSSDELVDTGGLNNDRPNDTGGEHLADDLEERDHDYLRRGRKVLSREPARPR